MNAASLRFLSDEEIGFVRLVKDDRSFCLSSFFKWNETLSFRFLYILGTSIKLTIGYISAGFARHRQSPRAHPDVSPRSPAL